MLVLNGIAVEGQHGAVGIFQLNPGRVNVEHATDQSFHTKPSISMSFPFSLLPSGGRKMPEEKANKSEPISDLDDMVWTCLLWRSRIHKRQS